MTPARELGSSKLISSLLPTPCMSQHDGTQDNPSEASGNSSRQPNDYVNPVVACILSSRWVDIVAATLVSSMSVRSYVNSPRAQVLCCIDKNHGVLYRCLYDSHAVQATSAWLWQKRGAIRITNVRLYCRMQSLSIRNGTNTSSLLSCV